MKKFSQIIAITIFLSNFANAEDVQRFNVQSNDTVVGIISEKELSRVIFDNDSIKQIYSIGGELYYEIADKDLYVKPAVNKPINFFVDTEKGNTYKFIVTPKDIPAVQVFIKNRSVTQKDQGSKYGGELIFRKKLSKILSASMSDDETVDFKKKSVNGRISKDGWVSKYLDSKWEGEGLIALKYYVGNLSNQPQYLNRSDYLHNQETIAVYLSDEELAPKAEGVLIIVRREQ